MADVTSATNAAASQTGFGMLTGSQKNLGKNEFIKLLLAQMKNQDPLNPQDNSAYVAQLAQFSSLEQSIGMNDRLDQLGVQMRGQSNSDSIGIVGKSATVKGSMVTIDGTGMATPISFNLAGATEKTTVKIQDQSGAVVKTIELGKRAGGFTRINWDTKNMAGNLQPAGTYKITVNAANAGGSPVGVEQQSTGIVKEISFDKGYPVLLLDSGQASPISDLLRVASPPLVP